MRIISQDGTIDFPYNYFSLSTANGKYEDVEVTYIYCHNLSSPNGTKLAEYSTEEKAKKAMEMLRKAYEDNEYYHHIANSDSFAKIRSLMSKEQFQKSTTEYFHFPQDEEIEV